MDNNQFREKVHSYRRPSGHSQQELADILGIQRQVLARKFSGKAYFTHHEVKQIVRALADWQAISYQNEAFELLALMDMHPLTAFSSTDWNTSPLFKLERDGLPSLPALLTATNKNSTSFPHHNLPVPLTGLVGREGLLELASERLLQKQVRLLTLVGPGGIGKTRLGLELGRRLIAHFVDGVWFVDLSGLTDRSQLPATLAHVVGLSSVGDNERLTKQLKDYLAGRKVLLILDNFEQILGAANRVSELLKSAPGLKVLVTSRIALQLYGESQLSVPPLELPDPANLLSNNEVAHSNENEEPRKMVAALEHFEAIELFVSRAQAVTPTFRLSPANFREVARLCILLEGWPLSIELAAARTKLMSLPFLLQRLSESRLDTLSKSGSDLPVRQQTLRITLDWSYNLLDSSASLLFNRLSIFKGSFDLAAVAAICFPPVDPKIARQEPPELETTGLAILDNLVDQSLLKSFEGLNGEPRFIMLETLREYALEKLRASGQIETLYSHYQSYYSQLAQNLTANFYIAPEDREGLTRILEQDFDNFQAVQYRLNEWQTESVTSEPEQEAAETLPAYMLQIEGSVLIKRNIEEVFSYVSQAQNWPQWNSLIKECRPVEPGPVEIGQEYYVVSFILGRRHEQIVKLREYTPDRLLELHTIRGPVKVTHRLLFSLEGPYTRLSFTTTNGIGEVFRLTKEVLKRIIRRGIEIQLKRLKAVLEDENFPAM